MEKQDIETGKRNDMDIEMTMMAVFQRYWDLRNSGDVGEARSAAHEEVLSLLRELHIPFDDREDAAQLAKDIKNNAIPAARYVALLLKNNENKT